MRRAALGLRKSFNATATAAGDRCLRFPTLSHRAPSSRADRLRPRSFLRPSWSRRAPHGLTAPIRLAACHSDLSGAIALIDLPYKRWSALADPDVANPLANAFERGAAAAVLITNGPTKKAIALNVTTRKPGAAKPVVILAPAESRPFLTAATTGEPGSLVVDGRGGRRSAFNLIARLERHAANDMIISTPRSGWFNLRSRTRLGLDCLAISSPVGRCTKGGCQRRASCHQRP